MTDEYEAIINESEIESEIEDESSIGSEIDELEISGSITESEIAGSAVEDNIVGEIQGEVLANDEYIPYIGATKDADLNTKSIVTSGVIAANQLSASNSITLNNDTITEWPSGEWGGITGSITNQTDLIAELDNKENVGNKTIDTNLGTSDILYPTQNAVKQYVDAAVLGLNTNQSETFVLTEQNLLNKYVILTKTITDINSIRVFVDDEGLKAQPGVDYSVSDQYVYWTGYNFQTKLETGEKLIVFYY